MHCFKKVLATICAIGFGTGVQAATIDAQETFSFSATVTEAGVLCGPFVGDEVDCDENFGTYTDTMDDDLFLGMSVGSTYNGQVTLRSSDGLIREASCRINNKDCNFGTDFLLFEPAFVGPLGRVEFLDFALSLMAFDFAGITGTATFSSDYIFGADGLHYYAGTTFDLTDVSYSVTPVPLPAPAALLLLGLGGLLLAKRRSS